MSTEASTQLAELVERFRRDTGYPTDADKEQKLLQVEWREKLLPENIEALSREELATVVNDRMPGKAGYAVPGSGPPDFLRDMESATYEHLLQTIKYLCWGPEPLADRIDAVDDTIGARGTLRSSGYIKLSGTNVTRLLAICVPDRFLPLGSQNRSAGREMMLDLLGLSSPEGDTLGRQCVDSNDRLRRHLADYFDDDPHEIASFLYWLKKNRHLLDEDGTPGAGRGDSEDPGRGLDLKALAERLLVGVDFLEDIVELLKDKGQVILYGPPGTGKTYLARELAKELAPEDSRRSLVQFHPSTSYEDFFEGYRPVGEKDGDGGTADDGGGIRYRLTPGPLARMAERASMAPGERHVMVIDEINRGNLPRVLGELLFLLEYRDERIHPLYRPDRLFSLPPNLWFIGTMNTADRSIALVDAALRRRFHFVRFFPDSGAISGLLDQWLERKGHPAWVGRLVAGVNDELKADLEGSHLLLGPSHFMKEYGSAPDEQRDRLRRIWEYNIEPFIEDQFFGDPDRIERYRFAAVFARHGPSLRTADADASAAGATGGGSPDPAGDRTGDGVVEAEDTADGDDAPGGSDQTAE